MAIRTSRAVFGFFSFLIALAAIPVSSVAQVSVAITVGPPALPVYEQPLCPADGYIWTPGYWAYDYDYNDYYWVPGTWVLAPEVGYFWTPAYWGWAGDRFVFYEGYWGPQVGFYGGINYGFGYFGDGYEGGRWNNGQFFYNRSVSNVNVTNIHNVYNTTVVNNTTTVSRVSYNGGNGGVNARPTAQQEAVAHEKHIPPVAAQTQHVQAAQSNPELRASANHGKPAIAATPKPAAFKDSGVVPAKQAGAPYTPPTTRAAVQPKAAAPAAETAAPKPENNEHRPGTAVHPNELPARPRPDPPNTGNPGTDKQYQQEQQQLRSQQDKERQELQQRQEQDHQKLEQQNADAAKKQQVEQQHQQQTQELEQKHVQQEQQMQQRQQPPKTNQQK